LFHIPWFHNFPLINNYKTAKEAAAGPITIRVIYTATFSTFLLAYFE